MDTLSPDPNNPAAISLSAAQAALTEGRYQYLALGDRHSLTQVDPVGRVWYSGAPVATDFDEVRPGCVLVVEVDRDAVSATPHEIGAWRFRTETRDLTSNADLGAFERLLQDADAKDVTVLRLALKGSLTLRQRHRLDEMIEGQRDLYAALFHWQRHTDLIVVPTDGDFADMGLSGFAQNALARLRAQAGGTGDDAATARDALALLVRLAGPRS